MSAPAAPESSSSTQDGCAAERPGTVKKALTANRRRAIVENPEYAAFARRILKACARRIAASDIESLALMAELADTIDSSIRDAVTGLREHGYSWADIGSRLGVTPPSRTATLGQPALTRILAVPVACPIGR
jgi:hypothetical protein